MVHLRFNVWVLLMALLTFSMPLVSLAEQHIGQSKAPETGATQDSNALKLQAKADAQRDANNDFDKVLWSFASVVPFLGGAVGALGGCAVGALMSPSNSLLFYAPSGGELMGASIGCLVFGCIPLISIRDSIVNYKPTNLPLDRFIGKSPEYVESYTEFYKEETQRLRKRTVGWAR